MSLSDDLDYPACECGGNANGLFTVRSGGPDGSRFKCLHCGARWSEWGDGR